MPPHFRLGLCLLLSLACDSEAAQAAKNNLALCGSVACPAGYHVVAHACNLAACGGACPNQTECVPNHGTWFTQCGPAACPEGFRAGSQSCNVAACGGSCPNQTVCVRH
jgi:hypothetical protein